jgi:hypothetical protein
MPKKPAPERRDAPIAFRIKPSLKRALEAAAKADRLTMSGYIEKLFEEDLREKGFLPAEDPNQASPRRRS